jgi:hypothetical protein
MSLFEAALAKFDLKLAERMHVNVLSRDTYVTVQAPPLTETLGPRRSRWPKGL